MKCSLSHVLHLFVRSFIYLYWGRYGVIYKKKCVTGSVWTKHFIGLWECVLILLQKAHIVRFPLMMSHSISAFRKKKSQSSPSSESWVGRELL